MLAVNVTLVGTSPYSPSRAHETPKKDKEGPDAYEKRTWLEKGHYNEKNQLYVPMMAFKQALDSAAKLLGEQIPGKGKQTYTKHFLSGVMCNNNLNTGIPKDQCQMERIYANSDGVRGSGKRVWRMFPVVQKWQGDLQFIIMDNTITPEILLNTLETAGMFIGVGRFRPEKGGINGRFDVAKHTIGQVDLAKKGA